MDNYVDDNNVDKLLRFPSKNSYQKMLDRVPNPKHNVTLHQEFFRGASRILENWSEQDRVTPGDISPANPIKSVVSQDTVVPGEKSPRFRFESILGIHHEDWGQGKFIGL